MTNAVLCAQEIHSHHNDSSKKFNKDFQLSIGLNAGVPVTEKDSIFEDTIKLAERFCELVLGKIVISPEVKDLYESENLNVKLNHKNIKILSVGEEKFINLLMDYTEKEWTNAAFNSNDFSKNMGFSKSQLYRKMIGLTGKSPNSFIKDYRLKKALQLLDKKPKIFLKLHLEPVLTVQPISQNVLWIVLESFHRNISRTILYKAYSVFVTMIEFCNYLN